MIQAAVIAVNRFGLGARPNELAQVALDPKAWLFKQMTSLQFDNQIANTTSAFEMFSAHRKTRTQRRKSQAAASDAMMENKKPSMAAAEMTNYGKLMRQTQKALLVDGFWQSVQTSQPFSMRLLDFFSNHFSVSTSTVQLNVLGPLLEREAIAPNLFGQFEDLLIAVIKHPAMLLYLDNPYSIGPRSKAGKKNNKRGLNENLAREILELHTLGVDGAYSIDDIQSLAKAISGWSVSHPRDAKQQGFVYRENFHEPGKRLVLGKSYRNIYGEKGVRQGEFILKDLARHPATARFVSHKLAQYFISDNPDTALVNAMANTWQKTNGNLHAVMTTLIEHDSSWQPERQKFKTPREFVVSTLRAIEAKPDKPRYFFKGIIYHLTEMGQQPFEAGSPAGYSNHSDAWTGSDALMKRIDWVNKLNAVTPKSSTNVLTLAEQLFADTLSEQTVLTIKRAESAKQARTLLFMSPEFQRR
jgi:uncharacterized protein (DUF1800 family)